MYLRDTPDKVKLKRPLKLEVLPTDEGRFEVFAPALDLGGVGDSLERAAQDLVSIILTVWEQFAEAPDSTLAPDGADLARRMRSTFERRE
jgi:hypothetical protein